MYGLTLRLTFKFGAIMSSAESKKLQSSVMIVRKHWRMLLVEMWTWVSMYLPYRSRICIYAVPRFD